MLLKQEFDSVHRRLPVALLREAKSLVKLTRQGRTGGESLVLSSSSSTSLTNNVAKRKTAGRRLIGILGKFGTALGWLAGHNSLPFTHYVKPIGGKIGEGFLFPIRPQDLRLIDALMLAQPEVQTKIMLR